MSEIEEKLGNSLKELREKSKERKFNQTVDLIVNFQKFNLKKDNVNLFVTLPHKIKDKKIAGFLEVKNKNVDTITPNEFKKYSDKKELKKLTKKYEFFMAQANLMPKVASTFGRYLGPKGKMPSPQLGLVNNPDEKTINEVIQKINTSIKIRPKEASIKTAIGKEKMEDKEIIENIMAVYNSLLKNLPKGKDNIKNIEIKFTMTKPQKIKV
ncbi:MAG TPA: hypothetical protein VJ912_02720 [Candidatus Nanoarchaeia archaeon]|nr:hypothetical protein [Candidatus Nanoarchaeia archaeon]